MSSTLDDVINGISTSMAVKVPCRVATTGPITLAGAQTIDGVNVVAGDRVLVKNQSDQKQNGIYNVSTTDWVRAKDFDGNRDIADGTLVKVNAGNTSSGFWYATVTAPVTVGISNIAFAQASSVLAVFSAYAQSLLAAANDIAARAVLGMTLAAKGSILAGTGSNAVTENTVGNDGSILTAQSGQSSGLIWVPNYPASKAPNPFFQVFQRDIGSVADDTYMADRWFALTQTGAITFQQQSLQENGQATNLRLTQSQATAQRFGLACILEASESQPLRGQQWTFRPRVRISASQALRIAVLEWTGTANTVTSDVVNSWTNGTFTAGNFFVGSNFTVSGVGAKTPSAATWTDMDGLTVTFGSSVNNIVLVIWVEQVAAQNVTLDVGKVRFVPGPYAGDILVPRYEDALRHAMRFYQRYRGDTDGVMTMPGGMGQVVSASSAYFCVPFPVALRRSPMTADISSSRIGDLRINDGAAAGVVASISNNQASAFSPPFTGYLATTLIFGTNAVLTTGRACRLYNIGGSNDSDIQFNVEL